MKAPADASLRRSARLASRVASLSRRGEASTTNVARQAARRSISASGAAAPTSSVLTSRPSAPAAWRSVRAWISVDSPSVRATTCRTVGTASWSAVASRVIPSLKSQKNPVTLPPGRERLFTKQLPLGRGLEPALDLVARGAIARLVLAHRIADVAAVTGELAQGVDRALRGVDLGTYEAFLLLGHGQDQVGGGEDVAVGLEVGGDDRVLREVDAVLAQHEAGVERGDHAVTRVGPDAAGADPDTAVETARRQHLLEQRVRHHAAAGVGLTHDEHRPSHACRGAGDSTGGRRRPTSAASRGTADPWDRCRGSASSRAGS